MEWFEGLDREQVKAVIEFAARNHCIDHDRVMMESLISIRRAGASIILTYFAKVAARLLA